MEQGKINYSNFEYLNIPGKELNENKIHRANNIISRKENIIRSH